MGKKDDWCSSKGLENRAKGMYKKEKKSTKICYLILWACSCIAYLVIGGLHAERSANAGKINSDYDVSLLISGVVPYDTCHVPDYIKDPDVSDADFMQA